MKATIKPYHSGVHKGFIIIMTDSQGGIVERIAVTEVVVEGDPWPELGMYEGNSAKLIN